MTGRQEGNTKVEEDKKRMSRRGREGEEEEQARKRVRKGNLVVRMEKGRNG